MYERGSDGKQDTFALLTTEPNPLMQGIHDRMPVILFPEAANEWLKSGPITQEEFSRFSTPYPAEQMEEWAVAKAVGNVRNDGPELVRPVPEGEIVAERPSGERLRLRSKPKAEPEPDLPGFNLNSA